MKYLNNVSTNTNTSTSTRSHSHPRLGSHVCTHTHTRTSTNTCIDPNTWDKKVNVKKLLCNNTVNGTKCIYKHKCLFAHTLDEQHKEPLRQYISDMIYCMEDLSDVNIYKNRELFDEIMVCTNLCTNCVIKKCAGGHNCRFGACLEETRICRDDFISGRCLNTVTNGRCVKGVHLTEKNLIPYEQYSNSHFASTNTDINFNSKHNVVSFELNDGTMDIMKKYVKGDYNKYDIIGLMKKKKYFGNNYDSSKIEVIIE